MEIVRDIEIQRDSQATVVVLCAEEEIRDVISYWFTSLPVRTLATADGYEANRLLKTLNNALLVTDRVLPPWPGLDHFLKLRADNPLLRVAFVDDGTPDARILARLTGATAVLSRPLTRQAVVESLRNFEPVS